MNERSNKYAINALKERRAEIDGELEACRRRLENLTEAIIHLDASLALLDPTYDPALVRPKRPYRHAKRANPGRPTASGAAFDDARGCRGYRGRRRRRSERNEANPHGAAISGEARRGH
jgi:hypothetical protein